MAKALIINAFALAGRIGICDTFTQGVALGYGLLPPSGRTAVTFDTPSPTDCIVNSALQFSVSNIIIPKIRYSEY